MEIFIDSANMDEIDKWVGMGIADGVTTNPSIMLKDGAHDMEKRAREIAALIDPLPLSVEVTTNDLDEMVVQARELASWAKNIVIKIPQETEGGTPCYGVMHRLEEEGIRVNATAAMSLGQVILAAKAGASYISLFAGRIGDEGGDPTEVITNAVDWLECWRFKGKVIVGSIRSVGDVLQAVMTGAHIITVPPQFLGKMADHKNTRDTVRQFTADARKAMSALSGARA